MKCKTFEHEYQFKALHAHSRVKKIKISMVCLLNKQTILTLLVSISGYEKVHTALSWCENKLISL